MLNKKNKFLKFQNRIIGYLGFFNLNEKKRTFFIEVSSELVFHNISKL